MADAKRIRVDGIEVEYEEHGRGARPFVLVHGFTGSRDDWADVVPELAALGRTVLLDQRGHGGSTNTGDPSDYRFEQLVSDLAGFLDAVGIDACDLLGHSLGGMVVLRLALAEPQRIRSLLLMDTAPGPVHTGLTPEALALASRVAREEGMGRLHELGRALAAQDPGLAPARRAAEQRTGERYWERVRTKLEAMDPEAFAALGALLGEHESVEARLGELRCPTSVMVGAQDERLLSAADVLARRIPGARRVTIPDAAHSPQMENTLAWLDAVRAHLAWARSHPAPR